MLENPLVQQMMGYGEQGWDVAKGWLLSPAAWSQFAAIPAAVAAAVCLCADGGGRADRAVAVRERRGHRLWQAGISFSLMAIVRGLIAGSILFWLGRWSNDQSAAMIGKQEELRPATRQLAAKAAEIAIFGIAFLLLMNIIGIDLSTLAVLGGAIGVGLGFGLQKIASNFISGVILLLEGQATVGDYVELDGGEAGTIVKMTARAIILETFDGRWIVVPNEDFIVTRVVNYSDQGSANRCVDFAVEFWVNGIDDGRHKYENDVLFIIWNTLKENGVTIPYPQRVIERSCPGPRIWSRRYSPVQAGGCFRRR